MAVSTAVEVRDRDLLRRYMYSVRMIAERPRMFAEAEQFHRDLQDPDKRAALRAQAERETAGLADRLFEHRAEAVREGWDPLVGVAHHGITPYTAMPEFFDALPFREINPFKGARSPQPSDLGGTVAP